MKADGKPAQPQLNTAGTLTSMVQAADAPDGTGSPGSVTYEFDAGSPGTYLYSSGTDTDKQLQMGLYGALVVRPAGHADQVNDRADSAFNPDHEYLFLLSEVDPDVHLAVERGEPVRPEQLQRPLLHDQRAQHAGHPGAEQRDLAAQPAVRRAWSTSSPYDAQSNPRPALIRYLNAGTVSYPFHPHGSDERVVNIDGHALEGPNGEDLAFLKFDLVVHPGQSQDALMDWRDVENWNAATNPIPVEIPPLQDQSLPGTDTWFSESGYLGHQGEPAEQHHRQQRLWRVLPHRPQSRPRAGHELRSSLRRHDDGLPHRPAVRLHDELRTAR